MITGFFNYFIFFTKSGYADLFFFHRHLRHTICSQQTNQENHDTQLHRVGKDSQSTQPSTKSTCHLNVDDDNTAYQELGEITQVSQYDTLTVL